MLLDSTCTAMGLSILQIYCFRRWCSWILNNCVHRDAMFKKECLLTCSYTVKWLRHQVIDLLPLIKWRPTAVYLVHCCIGIIYPFNQPFQLTVTAEHVPSQIPAWTACQLINTNNAKADCVYYGCSNLWNMNKKPTLLLRHPCPWKHLWVMSQGYYKQGS